jgi:hypothetical protein
MTTNYSSSEREATVGAAGAARAQRTIRKYSDAINPIKKTDFILIYQRKTF